MTNGTMQKEGGAVLALEGVHYSLWYYTCIPALAPNSTLCYARSNEVPSLVYAIPANRGCRGACCAYPSTENRRTSRRSFWRKRQLELGISYSPRPRERTLYRHYRSRNSFRRIVIDIAVISP